MNRAVDGEGYDRKWAAVAVAPFLLVGLADLVLLLVWGLDPLWGFMILPPILFMSALAWLAFRTGFAADRTGRPDEDAVRDREPDAGVDPD